MFLRLTKGPAGVSIGAGESQSMLSSVKLQTTKEEKRLLKNRKKLKALGVSQVVNPSTCHSIKRRKSKNRRFFRR